MASPISGNAFQTYQAIGRREDLEDVIYDISPVETPFLTMAKRLKATNTFHEWQTDVLAAASATNAAIEGDDAANGTSTPTVRLGNYTQISTKYAVVTDTQLAVDSAGRSNEMSYQIAKRLGSLKRDMEANLTQNGGSTAGSAASARTSAGLESWLTSTTGNASVGNSTSIGTGGNYTTPGFASGGFAGPTDASNTATFTVTPLKNTIRKIWDDGGNPGVIMVGGAQKQTVSGFSGIATLYREAGSTAKGTAIVGAADIYISDFGEHRIVPNRFQRNRTAFCLDMDYWGVAYLRKVSQKEIARTGGSEKRYIDVEYTLVSMNQLASGKIADLT